MTQRLLSDLPHRAHIGLEQLQQPLATMMDALPDVIAKTEMQPLANQLAIFGLHAARLDIREESARINHVLAELLRGLDLHPDYLALSEDQRFDLLADFVVIQRFRSRFEIRLRVIFNFAVQWTATHCRPLLVDRKSVV